MYHFVLHIFTPYHTVHTLFCSMLFVRFTQVEGSSQVALVVKNPPASPWDVRDAGLIPGLGWSAGRGNGNPPQYSCLENSMNRGAWWATEEGRKELDVTERLTTPRLIHGLLVYPFCLQSVWIFKKNKRVCPFSAFSPFPDLRGKDR